MRIKTHFILLLLIFTYSCAAKNLPTLDLQIDGKWFVTLKSNDIGVVNTVFEFETDENHFEAWTRKGADRNILGFWKSTLARIFTKDFKNGSLIRITDGTITKQEDTLLLSGIFRSAVGSYYFNGEIINGQLSAELTNSKHEIKGIISGRNHTEISLPIDKYPEIIAEAIDIAKQRIFNRKVLETKQWSSFEKTMLKKSNKFQDDVELVFAFYYYASKLPFSHFALTKIDTNVSQQTQTSRAQHLYLEEKDSNTALLRITSFRGSAEEVESSFNEIIEKAYDNLIVDLRNNSGGTVEAGMAFARKVVDTTIIGGVFLTQKWFNDNESLPDQSQFDDFPFFSEANYDMIIEGIHNEKGLVLRVEPSEVRFKGNLFIITNRRTASTCEPIVHGLKHADRAIIVGETTAGAMLNGERFDLKSGFSLFVPTADYYTATGFKIDQTGVEPNIRLTDEEPVEYIMKQLIQ